MSQITQAVLEEKVAQLSAQVSTLQRLVVVLVYKIAKGKNVSISKGDQKQADQKIGGVDFRQMSSGEIRFTVTPPEKEKE